MGFIDAIKGEIKASRNIKKGSRFEDFVEQVLFPESMYNLLYKTHEFNKNGRKIESQQWPDFQFEDIRSGHRFWVEAKFRSNLYQGKIQWAEPWQFKRYKEFQEQHNPEKVFIAIGHGGKPMYPERIYIPRLDHIDYPAIYPSKLKEYEITEPPAKYRAGRIF